MQKPRCVWFCHLGTLLGVDWGGIIAAVMARVNLLPGDSPDYSRVNEQRLISTNRLKEWITVLTSVVSKAEYTRRTGESFMLAGLVK
jgi:hypothetical protein